MKLTDLRKVVRERAKEQSDLPDINSDRKCQSLDPRRLLVLSNVFASLKLIATTELYMQQIYMQQKRGASVLSAGHHSQLLTPLDARSMKLESSRI